MIFGIVLRFNDLSQLGLYPLIIREYIKHEREHAWMTSTQDKHGAILFPAESAFFELFPTCPKRLYRYAVQEIIDTGDLWKNRHGVLEWDRACLSVRL